MIALPEKKCTDIKDLKVNVLMDIGCACVTFAFVFVHILNVLMGKKCKMLQSRNVLMGAQSVSGFAHFVLVFVAHFECSHWCTSAKCLLMQNVLIKECSKGTEVSLPPLPLFDLPFPKGPSGLLLMFDWA